MHLPTKGIGTWIGDPSICKTRAARYSSRATLLRRKNIISKVKHPKLVASSSWLLVALLLQDATSRF